MYSFWTSRNLNVTIDKQKQTCFAEAPREFCTTIQGTFLISIHMHITIILVYKFISDLSRFGYDCNIIVASLLNLGNMYNQCNS